MDWMDDAMDDMSHTHDPRGAAGAEWRRVHGARCTVHGVLGAGCQAVLRLSLSAVDADCAAGCRLSRSAPRQTKAADVAIAVAVAVAVAVGAGRHEA